VLDRASTFAQPGIIALLQSRIIPVALDQAYERRQQDAEGEFYRRIAAQGPRHDFEATTQGFYLATASGQLLLYMNNRDPEKLERLLRDKLAELGPNKAVAGSVAALEPGLTDPRWDIQPPKDGLVVRVRAKITGGYSEPRHQHEEVFQAARSRDNLWITAAEHRSLAAGEFPQSLVQRMARFHLVDNTRGEPPLWEPADLQTAVVSLDQGVVTGHVSLRTISGDRTYEAGWRGHIETEKGHVTRFDLVVFGDFSGGGPFTPNPPSGKFPLAISFSLADGSDIADAIPPQGARGWVAGYLGAGEE
jgi:hypothetical protein